ncbi:MAG: dihydroneopterin aldolase [Alphaproteobacteria bacterium]
MSQDLPTQYFIIHLDEICLEWPIGVYAAEQDKMQPLIITLALGVDLPAAAYVDDDYNHTLCYDLLTQEIEQLVRSGHVNLLEVLANNIADLCLSKALVKMAKIIIKKPNALQSRFDNKHYLSENFLRHGAIVSIELVKYS